MKEELSIAIQAGIEAGKVIMEIYQNGNFEIESKDDDSPLTLADKKANDIINSFLQPTHIPIISEENKQVDYNERKDWEKCWIVDPLDGTKEFIKKNGEFTVNIALISNNQPVLGVIVAPALNTLYFADVLEKKAFKLSSLDNFNFNNLKEQAKEISPSTINGKIKVVGSRSHMNEETRQFIENLWEKYQREIEVVSKGSSLKFCLVAEGEAQIYPRFAPTMEWDTAAGQAICEAVGLRCVSRDTGRSMNYNRENLLNGHFFVSYEG